MQFRLAEIAWNLISKMVKQSLSKKRVSLKKEMLESSALMEICFVNCIISTKKTTCICFLPIQTVKTPVSILHMIAVHLFAVAAKYCLVTAYHFRILGKLEDRAD